MIWRRKRSVVDIVQQMKFALEVVAASIGFVVLSLFLLFVSPMSSWFGGDPTGERLLNQLVLVGSSKWPILVLSLATLFLIGVLMAQRLAGPMKGMNSVFSNWAKGNRKARVHFRRYDYIRPMMEPLNTFLDTEERIVTQAESLAQSIVSSSDASPMKKEAEDFLAHIRGDRTVS